MGASTGVHGDSDNNQISNTVRLVYENLCLVGKWRTVSMIITSQEQQTVCVTFSPVLKHTDIVFRQLNAATDSSPLRGNCPKMIGPLQTMNQ